MFSLKHIFSDLFEFIGEFPWEKSAIATVITTAHLPGSIKWATARTPGPHFGGLLTFYILVFTKFTGSQRVRLFTNFEIFQPQYGEPSSVKDESELVCWVFAKKQNIFIKTSPLSPN